MQPADLRVRTEYDRDGIGGYKTSVRLCQSQSMFSVVVILAGSFFLNLLWGGFVNKPAMPGYHQWRLCSKRTNNSSTVFRHIQPQDVLNKDPEYGGDAIINSTALPFSMVGQRYTALSALRDSGKYLPRGVPRRLEHVPSFNAASPSHEPSKIRPDLI